MSGLYATGLRYLSKKERVCVCIKVSKGEGEGERVEGGKEREGKREGEREKGEGERERREGIKTPPCMHYLDLCMRKRCIGGMFHVDFRYGMRVWNKSWGGDKGGDVYCLSCGNEWVCDMRTHVEGDWVPFNNVIVIDDD